MNVFCTACGRQSADEFCFCPHCGKALSIKALPAESTDVAPEVQAPMDAQTGQRSLPKEKTVGETFRPGTIVFGVFSAVTCMVAISRGFPPIYILEAIGWAGAAWYWQRKKTHGEFAKGTVVTLAVVVAIGEVAHIAIRAHSGGSTIKSSGDNPFVAIAEGRSDPYAGFGAVSIPVVGSKTASMADQPADAVLECPSALPAGVGEKPLPSNESSNLAGLWGELISNSAPWPAPDDLLLWDAHLGFGNKTTSCISMVVVEFDLDHGGTLSKERHSVLLSPIGPGMATDAYVNLNIKTGARSGGVELLGWRIVSVSGFKPQHR